MDVPARLFRANKTKLLKNFLSGGIGLPTDGSLSSSPAVLPFGSS
jgi:hypothetical protein